MIDIVDKITFQDKIIIKINLRLNINNLLNMIDKLLF